MRELIRFFTAHKLRVAVLAAACAAGVACGEGSSTAVGDHEPSTRAEPAAAAEFQPGAELLAVLAEADRADGSEDKIVTRCAGCGLAMDGSAKHALALGGYELHFCSDTCENHFREEPQAGLEALAEARQTTGGDGGS